MRPRPPWIAGVALVALAIGPLPARATDLLAESVLATVGSTSITVAEFEREMSRRGGGQAGAFATPEQRRELLDQLIQERSLLAAARAAGYERDPEVVAVTERMMVARLRQDRLDPRLQDVEVSDEDVAAFYRAHEADYAVPERVRAAMVFIAVHPNASEEKRAELEQRAEQALAEARALDPSIRHFGPVARAYSDDRASRYQGGVLGWLIDHPSQSYRWEPEVGDAVFALEEPGEIGPIVRTDKGLYLVRLVDREAATHRPLEVLDDGIRQRLLRERRQQLEQAFLTEVATTVPTEVDAQLLASLEPPETMPAADETTQPPPLPAD